MLLVIEMENLKKILAGILGVIVFIALCFIFFYAAIFFLIAMGIYYIYYRFFKKSKPSNNKKINTVIIDMEED